MIVYKLDVCWFDVETREIKYQRCIDVIACEYNSYEQILYVYQTEESWCKQEPDRVFECVKNYTLFRGESNESNL